jgi:predicted aspartyl protease
MRIDGEWFECDDGLVRPVIRGEILNASGAWESALFLVDTGADCTVISAAVFDVLGFESAETHRQLGGIGGVAESVGIATQIRLARDDGGEAVFRGRYSAFTQLESLDMSVLGRDILQMFAVIVDRPDGMIALIRPNHRYRIETR